MQITLLGQLGLHAVMESGAGQMSPPFSNYGWLMDAGY